MPAWVLPVIEGIQFIMEAVAFSQFIEEESIQACMLGAYLGLRNRNYQAVKLALDTTESTLLPHLEAWNTILGWLSPYSLGPFADYCLSTRTQIDVYRQLLSAGVK
jgi:hypothetical protein